MVIAAVLGEKKPNDDRLRPYESGIIPTGSARYRYPLPFFLIAVFFLLFDAGRLPLSRPPQAVAIILIIVMLVGGMYPHLLIELAIKAVLAL
jgi:NADH:ubiquinone oxidoreductase subunit 3 (subunit A)